MADEQTTTEVADNPTPETEQNSESVLGSGISDNQTETDWKSSLPEELKNEPTLQNLNDVESLAKTVVHQQKMIGSRIPLPKNDEEKAELYNKLGRPEDPTKYDLSIPDTHKQHFNETAVGEFKNVAHKIGLNNDQVNALLEYQVNQIDNTGQLQEAQMNVQREEAEQTLKQEWGYDYDKNLRSAMRAIDVYGDEGLKEVLNGPAGNDPAMIKFFARLGQEVTEEMAKNTQNNTIAASTLDAKQEIEQIMADPKNPYFDSSHRDHKSMVERMRQLHEKVYGN